MTQCPICRTKVKDQDYCPTCAWDFEYYFDELSEEERNRYEIRFRVYQKIYEKSILEPRIIYKDKIIVQEKKGIFSKLFGGGSLEYSDIVEIDGLMYQNQPFTKKYTWEEAKEYAKNLRLAGYDDWRLPTRAEFNKISNIKMYGRYDSGWSNWYDKNKHRRLKGSKGKELFVREEFLENMQTKDYPWFWTSEEKDSSDAWFVYFYYGYDRWRNKTNHFYALCVR